MSEKYYVGLDVSSFEDIKKTLPVSRITLNIDSDRSITAGDDSGLEIVSDCAYATQEMANAILAKIKGYQYQAYTAEAANIDPAAEPGDGVTVGGIYGMLSNFSDDGSGFPGISAPGEMELEDEFPTLGGPLTRTISRKISDTNSRLTKTADEIRAEVSSEIEGLSSSFSVKVDAITERVETAEGDIGTLKLTAGTLETSMKNAQGDITTLKSTTSGLETTVKNHDGRITTAQQTADKISWLVKSGTSATNFELTDRAVSLVSSKITLKASGSLGGEAKIELSSGSSASIDLSKVRTAFANDKTAITIGAGTVTFGSNTFVVNSTNFKVSADGTVTATNGSFSGSVTATSGKIAGFTIASNGIYKGMPKLGDPTPGVFVGIDGIGCRADTGIGIQIGNGIITFENKGLTAGRIWGGDANFGSGIHVDAQKGFSIDLGTNYSTKGDFSVSNGSMLFEMNSVNNTISITCRSFVVNGKVIA